MHDSLSLYVKSTKNIGILTKKSVFWAFRGSKFGQIACFWAQSLCLGPIHMVWGFKIESEKNKKKWVQVDPLKTALAVGLCFYAKQSRTTSDG